MIQKFIGDSISKMNIKKSNNNNNSNIMIKTD